MRRQHGLTMDERAAVDWAMMGCVAPAPIKIREHIKLPATTQEVVMLLRKRGYNVDFASVSYLIRKEIVTPQREGERNYRWDRKAIDKAAAWFESKGEFLPTFAAASIEGYDPMQEELAYHLASNRTGVRDRDALVKIIVPGILSPGKSREPSSVVYLSADEFNAAAEETELGDMVGHALRETDCQRFMGRFAKHEEKAKKVRQ